MSYSSDYYGTLRPRQSSESMQADVERKRDLLKNLGLQDSWVGKANDARGDILGFRDQLKSKATAWVGQQLGLSGASSAALGSATAGAAGAAGAGAAGAGAAGAGAGAAGAGAAGSGAAGAGAASGGMLAGLAAL